MADEVPFLTGCQWIAEALSDLANATEKAMTGGSRHEVAMALQRIGAALERQAQATEALVEAVRETRGEKQ